MYKALDKWLLGYCRAWFNRPRSRPAPLHVIFTIADHFEPLSGGRVSIETGRERVARWVNELPDLAGPFRGSDGHPPRYTFFYPADEYEPELVARLTPLVANGWGEVEVHLHHGGETAAWLHTTLTNFRDTLSDKHGFLGRDADGQPRYAFVHGNWTLCNSHPSGAHCGIDNELAILRQTGCYVDMTMPSGPSPTQTRIVNAIYYSTDRPGPRSHDFGVPVQTHHAEAPLSVHPDNGDLMLIQGPLALNWQQRKWGVLPRIDYGELTGRNPPTLARADVWLRHHIHVVGRPDWIFVKVHTHGCDPRNIDTLLTGPLKVFFAGLQRWCENDQFRLYYATAREMYNMAKAAEAGASGSPAEWRDFVIRPPLVRQSTANA